MVMKPHEIIFGHLGKALVEITGNILDLLVGHKSWFHFINHKYLQSVQSFAAKPLKNDNAQRW